MAAYYWVDTVARGGIPTTALHGGVDIDGHQIYVGRAFHDGDWIPAKVIPGKHVAYVAYNGDEIAVDNFQVLCEQRFDWVPTTGGDIPPGAVEGGRTSDGEPLFIGRIEHEGSQTVGKRSPESSENCSCPQPTYPRGRPCSLSCCNPTNGFKPPFYHVLPPGYSPHIQYSAFRPIHPIDESSVKAYYWVDTHAWGGIPSTALHGGVDIDGEQIYVGRAYHNGDWLPAKVIPGRNIAYVSYGGEEHHKDSFQVLCEQRFDWIPNHGGYIPPGAIEGGRTSGGEILYIGRVEHEGTQTVGKVQPSHGVCYIPFDGKELSFEDYEILILRR